MATERIIGVDFGTSTSVIRVKRYQDGKPLGDPLEVKQVTFDQGNTMVPTLVQKRDSGETVYFGHDASISHKGTRTYANFKMDLENPDPDVHQMARKLTAEFFAYMAKTYRTQSEGGHLGETTDSERTIISYPVKWCDETKSFMYETAKAAGFPNVEGMDEAQAAIQAVTVQNAYMLANRGFFKEGVPVNILLIDMGAGTTDLVLCRHTPGTSPKTETLVTWPQNGGALFGGREVDELLKSMICTALPQDCAEVVLRKLGNEKFKAWKESIVSPVLQRNETVDEFSALDDLLDLLDCDATYTVDRDSFETTAADYLRCFPELVNGCLNAAKIDGSDVDLVILTGGHSQWYFVQEMLRGEMPQFGRIQLSKVQQEPERIIPIALPQETVALGLVYGEMVSALKTGEKGFKKLVHFEKKAPGCTTAGNPEYWRTKEEPYFYFADAQGMKPLTKEDTVYLSLGHDFEWQVKGNDRVQICTRCGATGSTEPLRPADALRVSTPMEEKYTPDSEFVFGNIGEDYVVREYIGNREVVSIPPVVRGRKVVAIGELAFGAKNRFLGKQKSIKKVIIPDTVKKILGGAFCRCMNLEEVIAHPGIELIGGGAFSECNSLQILDFGMGVPAPRAVKFPRNLREIGMNAFCANLNALHVKSIITEVTLSKKTKVHNQFGCKTFNPKYCAVFYYDE